MQHDTLVITRLLGMFKRLNFPGGEKELERLGRIYLEVSHAAFLTIVSQKTTRSRRGLEDLKVMLLALLGKHCTP